MATRTIGSTAHRNPVTRHHFIRLGRHVALAVVTEAVLNLLGVAPCLRIAVEIANLAIAAWRGHRS